ncbi:hypothetical protein GCM10009836_63140 [Pseudonocardia ailaonensis]|uniref:DUF3817 domain-containing protein n=1 Tax=Pseudonocardia ailaonensis TaxID=367279 RepID=A0ABN2NNU9_9PSEU
MGLRIAAAAEAVSLVVLLVNLVTLHLRPVTQLAGPLHGCAYLAVIALTVASTRAGRGRLLALVPGVGGALVLRFLARTERASPTGGRGIASPPRSRHIR